MRYDAVLIAILPTGREVATIVLDCGETPTAAINKAAYLSRTLDPETTLPPGECFIVDSLIDAVLLRWPEALFDITVRRKSSARESLRSGKR